MPTRDRSKVSKTKKEQREIRQRRQRMIAALRWTGLGIVALAIIGFLVWFSTRPVSAVGDEVPIDASTHVEEGSDPGPYASNPPAGGKHYPGTYRTGFYEEDDLAALPQKHEGYLVHNLEHGYVIFWYNCAARPDLDCEALKSAIRQVMDEVNNYEVIAFPWSSQPEPLVMTSWGRILRLDSPDLDKMREFYRVNHNKSPEPDAE